MITNHVNSLSLNIKMCIMINLDKSSLGHGPKGLETVGPQKDCSPTVRVSPLLSLLGTLYFIVLEKRLRLIVKPYSLCVFCRLGVSF